MWINFEHAIVFFSLHWLMSSYSRNYSHRSSVKITMNNVNKTTSTIVDCCFLPWMWTITNSWSRSGISFIYRIHIFSCNSIDHCGESSLLLVLNQKPRHLCELELCHVVWCVNMRRITTFSSLCPVLNSVCSNSSLSIPCNSKRMQQVEVEIKSDNGSMIGKDPLQPSSMLFDVKTPCCSLKHVQHSKDCREGPQTWRWSSSNWKS